MISTLRDLDAEVHEGECATHRSVGKLNPARLIKLFLERRREHPPFYRNVRSVRRRSLHPSPERTAILITAQSCKTPLKLVPAPASKTSPAAVASCESMPGRTNLSKEAATMNAVFRTTGEVSARIRNQVIKLKNQHPLRFLAVLAGVAGTAGAVTRVWRSSRDE